MRRTIATTNATIKCRNNDCYNFEIPLDGSQAIRDGDDLALNFPNGDRLVLEGYYRKSVSILLDGDEVPADDFFSKQESVQPVSSHGSDLKFEESPTQAESEEVVSLDGIGHLETIDSDAQISEDSAAQPFALSGTASAFLSQPEEIYFEQAAVTAVSAIQDQPASEVGNSHFMPLEDASGLGGIPAPDPEEYISADFFVDSDEVSVSIILGDAAVMQDKAGEGSRQIPNQELAETSGESAETPESATEKNEIHAAVSAESAAPAGLDKTPAAEGAVPAQPEVKTEAVAETAAPVVDSDDGDGETAVSSVDHTGTVSSDALDKTLVAELKPENQGTVPHVDVTATPVISTQDKNFETGELSETPVAESKGEIRETANSGMAAVEPVVSGSSESSGIADKTPVAEPQDETSETMPQVEKSDPVFETEAPVVDSKDEISETGQSKGESASPAGSVVGDNAEEPLDSVSENKNPVADSGDETSESVQSKSDGEDSGSTGDATDSGSDVSASQNDDSVTGSETEPEHTFRGAINLPEGVIGILRVVKQGKYGDIVQREDGEWVYQLNGAINSGDVQGSNTVPDADYVYVITEDKWGNKLRTKITVSIIDDVPELDVHADENLDSGSEFTGKISYTYGADYIDYDDHDPKHLDVVSGVETVSVNDFVNPIVIEGQYGVLTIQSNGKYSYTANPLLHGQEGGTDTFTFSITDADGDTVTKNLDGSVAGLTFTVTKPDAPEPPVISEVYEKALPDGTEPGDPSSTVTIPDGYTLVVKEGGDHPGHLEQNPDGSWKYVLDKPIASGDEQGSNKVSKGDTQTVILRDKDGNEWEFEVPVDIVDDAPVADDDSASITKGQESIVASGSVLDNDKYGADREADEDAFVWNTGELAQDENGRYVLEHGSIELNADGSYTYYLDNADHDVITLTEGKSLYDTLTYTIKDADGDVSTATLTIEIKGKNNGITITPKDPDKDPDPTPDPDDTRDKTPDPDPDPTDPDQPDPEIPTEPGDPDIPVDPSDPSTTAAVEQIKERELRSGDPVKRHGDLEISAPDGVASIMMNGEDLIDGELHTFETEIGTLTIRYDRESETGGRLKYEYTLNKAADHDKATSSFDNTDIVNEIFKFTVTDSDNTEANSRIIIRVIDDVPTAANDEATVEEGATAPITGNVLTGDAEGKGKDEFGADKAASEDSLVWNGLLVDGETREPETDSSIKGQYGVFKPGENGNWTYELDNTSEAVQALKGSYTDEDGVFHEAETLTEVIRYTIKDADGDTSEATLTIAITGKSAEPSITPEDPDPEVPVDPDNPDPDNPKTHGALITVHEKNLADGTDPDEEALSVSGTMAISAPDGVKSLYIGDQEIKLDGTPAEIKIGENVLTLTYAAASGVAGTLTYSFRLTDELSHKDGESLLDELLSKYQLTLTDLEGKIAKSALHVKVIDDAPEMTLAEDIELEAGHEESVDFSFIVGADNGDGKSLVIQLKDENGEFVRDSDGNVIRFEISDPNSEWRVEGQYGALWRDADGNFHYKANPIDEYDEKFDADLVLDENGDIISVASVKDTFTFTLIDADGDATETEDWTATINKPVYPGTTITFEGSPVTAFESALVDGDPVYEIRIPAGFEIIGVTDDPTHGEVFEEDGKWFYHLTERIDSGDIQGQNEVIKGDTFILWVERESDGADFEIRIPVNIHDDVPEIESSSQEVRSGKEISGEIAYDFGADSDGKLLLLIDGEERQISEEGLELSGDYGILKISSDGKWTYQANVGVEGAEIFNFRAVDGDGDVADASLNINVNDRPYFVDAKSIETFGIGIVPIEREVYWWVDGTGVQYEETAQNTLAGFIDVGEKLNSSNPFRLNGYDSENLDENRISFKVDKTDEHPAGCLIIEELSESRYFYIFKPEDGRQYDANFTLTANGINGENVEFSIICKPLCASYYELNPDTWEPYADRFTPFSVKDGKYDLQATYDDYPGKEPEFYDDLGDYKMFDNFTDYMNNKVYHRYIGDIKESTDSIIINEKYYSWEEMPYLMENDPNIGQNIPDSFCVSGAFSIYFGAKGQADAPFIIEENIEPVFAENGVWQFAIQNHRQLPNGILSISEAENGKYKYNFMPDSANLNLDGSLRLSAVNANGNIVSIDLVFSKKMDPTVINVDSGKEGDGISLGNFVVDEGTEPYHEHVWDGTHPHDSSGQNSFSVNLHGDDGTIQLGDIRIDIENNIASPDKTVFTTDKGVVIEFANATCDENGIWTICYNYSHNGEGQEHSGSNLYSLSDTIEISVASGDVSASGIISVLIHDDYPHVSNVEAETDEMGNSLSGIIALDFGADGAANVPATFDGIEAIGDIDRFAFTISNHRMLPDGKLTFTKNGDHYEYVFMPDDSDSAFNNEYEYLYIFDGDGSKTNGTRLTFSRPNPVSSDDANSSESGADFLIADDSLDDLLGPDSEYSTVSLTSPSSDASQLTEQEALVLEQAMRQVENQIS